MSDFISRLIKCLSDSSSDGPDPRIKELEDELEKRDDFLEEMKKAQEIDLKKLQEDLKRAEHDIAVVNQLLTMRINIPSIRPALVGVPLEVGNPFDYALFRDFNDKIDLQTSDDEYHVFSLDKWKEILAPIQAEVEDQQGRWTGSIGDCDNFALTMSSFVAIAFKDADLNRQGAFAYVKGGKIAADAHAYNGFLTDDDKFYIFEPQNGEVIGELHQGTGKYWSRRVHFLA